MEVSHQLLQQVLYNGAGSARVEVVLGLYRDNSIKKMQNVSVRVPKRVSDCPRLSRITEELEEVVGNHG